MEFLVKQTELLNALKIVKNTVGKGSNVNNQTDKCIYMRTLKDDKDYFLELTTTNLSELSKAICPISPVNNYENKEYPLIDFYTFYNLISTFDNNADLTINSQNNNLTLTSTNRKKPISMIGSDPKDFLLKDISENFTNQVSLNAGALLNSVSRASIVIIENNATPMYNCALFNIKSNKIFSKSMCVTAQKRMSLIGINTATVGEGQFLFEANKVKKTLSNLDLNSDVNIYSNDNVILFEQNKNKFLFRVISGNFPKIEKFLTAKLNNSAYYNRQDLINCLTRIKIMSDKNKTLKPCVFNIDNITSIDISTGVGSITEMLPTTLKGTPITLGFAIDTILDTLQNMDSQEISLSYDDEKSCIISPHKITTYLQKILVMCVNIQKDEKK